MKKVILIVLFFCFTLILGGCELIFSPATSAETTTTTEVVTTVDPTTIATTTEQTIMSDPLTTYPETTTQVPTTTQAPTTTQEPTTTQVPTTTQEPTTTQVPTTTQAPTTTSNLIDVDYSNIYEVNFMQELGNVTYTYNDPCSPSTEGEYIIIPVLIAEVENAKIDKKSNWYRIDSDNQTLSVEEGTETTESVTTSFELSTSLTFGVSGSVFSLEASVEFSFGREETIETSNSFSENFESNFEQYVKNTNYTVITVADYSIFQIFIYDVDAGTYRSEVQYIFTSDVVVRLVSSHDANLNANIDISSQVKPSLDLSLLFDTGNGTDEPFAIHNESELISMFIRPELSYVLEEDILLSNYRGSRYIEFSGVLDGKYNEIDNLDILVDAHSIDEDEFYGFVSKNSGVIKCMTLYSPKFLLYPTSPELLQAGSSFIYVGLLCGESSVTSRIEEVTVIDCEIYTHRVKSYNGFLVGLASGEITNCNVMTSTNFTYGYLGGIVAKLHNNGIIDGCVYSRYQTESTTYNLYKHYKRDEVRAVGGIAAICDSSTIINCEVSYIEFHIDGALNAEVPMGYIVGVLENSTYYNNSYSNCIHAEGGDLDNLHLNVYFPTERPFIGRTLGTNNFTDPNE